MILVEVEVPSVFLFSGKDYNNGIKNIHKFCNVLEECSNELSEISWDSNTIAEPLFQDKNNNDIHICCAQWGEVDANATNEVEKDVMCNRIRAASDLQLVAFMKESASDAEQYLLQKTQREGESLKIDLQDCFNVFTESTYISDTPNWFCKVCNKNVFAQSVSTIWRCPPVLILHLKRFEYIAQNISTSQNSIVNSELGKKKINTPVDFPLKDLNIYNYLTEEIKSQYSPEYCTYDLVAVSNHNGDANFGHYNAYCLDCNEGEDKWFDYNDSRVASISSDKVCSKFGYILFYVRKDCTKYTSKQLIEEMKAYDHQTTAPLYTEAKAFPFFEMEEQTDAVAQDSFNQDDIDVIDASNLENTVLIDEQPEEKKEETAAPAVPAVTESNEQQTSEETEPLMTMNVEPQVIEEPVIVIEPKEESPEESPVIIEDKEVQPVEEPVEEPTIAGPPAVEEPAAPAVEEPAAPAVEEPAAPAEEPAPVEEPVEEPAPIEEPAPVEEPAAPAEEPLPILEPEPITKDKHKVEKPVPESPQSDKVLIYISDDEYENDELKKLHAESDDRKMKAEERRQQTEKQLRQCIIFLFFFYSSSIRQPFAWRSGP